MDFRFFLLLVSSSSPSEDSSEDAPLRGIEDPAAASSRRFARRVAFSLRRLAEGPRSISWSFPARAGGLAAADTTPETGAIADGKL